MKIYNLLLEKTFNSIKNSGQLVALFSFFTLFLFSCNAHDVLETPKMERFHLNNDLKKQVEIQTVLRKPIQNSVTLTGEVVSNSDRTIPFTSMVDGVVSATYFSLGDYVKKGQILAIIKSASLNEIQDDTQSAQTQLLVAKRKLSSIKSMHEDGIASEKDLAEAQAEVNMLTSSITKSKKNLKLMNANTNGIQVKAPSDGYIINKNISEGMPVSAGNTQLFTISNLNNVWVMANVYASNMRHIYTNQVVEIKTLAYPDETFHGRINQIGQVFDAEERVLKAKIILDNPKMKLKPGMSADIILPIDNSGKSALAVPQSALIFDNNQNYVVIYNNDSDMVIRRVFELSTNNSLSYVEGELKDGEKVITKNALLIYETIK